MPGLQTVYRLPSKGAGYGSIQEKQESVPEAKPHEVVLRVHATTLNYRDLAIANGQYPFPVKDDVVPCSDVAGVITETGSAVETLKQGDTAIVNFDISNLYGPQQDWDHGLGGPIDGALREYIAVPASAVTPIPEGFQLSYAQLASLVCTGTTTWNALYGNLPLKPGHTVLALGTGGVSMTGMMLAKAAGATTIITSSSDDKLKLAKDKYGVDHTINYNTVSDWASEVNKIIGGRGADFILENGGAGTIKQSIECVARGGQVAVIGFLSQPSQDEMPDVAGLVLGKGCVVRGINVGAKSMTDDLVRFVTSRNLSVPVEKEFRFEKEEIINAFKLLESGGHVGKICIVW